jgi:hypothetical protein
VSKDPRPSCILCACKHLAQARAQLLEVRKGYAEHYWYALGHIAEAEDEVVTEHVDLAEAIREHRKELELYPKYLFPFKELILRTALVGGYDVDAILNDGEGLRCDS